MPLLVTLIRHAQGEHNLPPSPAQPSPHNIPDPPLTPLGITQCADLARRLSALTTPAPPPPSSSAAPPADLLPPITLIAASPLRRTLYTALLALEPELRGHRGLKVVALPDAQETSGLPCDTGSGAEVLRAEFEAGEWAGLVDLGAVGEGWDSKQGRWAPTSEAIQARARAVRVWLQAREEGHVVLVTHGGFLHYLTEDWTDTHKFEGTGWANGEFRTYQFVQGGEGGDENPTMLETPESKRRRGGEEKPLSEAERMELRETTLKSWEEKGF